MSDIQIGGGPAHNRVEVSLVSEVNECWKRFILELEKPGDHGINNNELKQWVNAFAQAGARLQHQVLSLPAQGRQLGFKGTDIAKAMQQMGKLRTPGA